jgi:hypothetical protein
VRRLWQGVGAQLKSIYPAAKTFLGLTQLRRPETEGEPLSPRRKSLGCIRGFCTFTKVFFNPKQLRDCDVISATAILSP